MSLSREDIYNALLNAGLTEEEIQEEIMKKADDYQDFMSEDGILFLVAKEKNLPIVQELYRELEQEIDFDEFGITISEVNENMTNLILLGKIGRIYDIRKFEHKDGTPGCVGSFILNDGTGEIKIVLWDEHTKIMKKDFFKINEIIRIINGYTKKNHKNNIEVHIGRKGRVILDPEDVELSRFPLLRNLQCSESNLENSDVNQKSQEKKDYLKYIEGVILKIEKFEEKTLENGEMTFLLKFLLGTELAAIHVVVWGMQAVECLKMIDENVSVKLRNMKIQFNNYTKMEELRFTKNSTLEIT